MWGAGIWHFDKRTGALQRIFTDTPSLNGAAWVSNIWADPRGTVWAVVNGSVCEFDPAQNIFRVRLNRSGGSELEWVNVLLKAADGTMFVGTVGEGLKIWDGKSAALKTYRFDPAWSGPLSNRIFTVFQDRSGQVWLGTFADGLVKFDPHPKPFGTFPVVEKGRPPGDLKNISGLLKTDGGDIWAASPQYGLRILDAGKHGFTALPNRPEWPAEFQKPGEKVIFQDRQGRFWLGTWGQGYLVWDAKTGEVHRFFYPGHDQTLVQQNLVACIFGASDGTIWVSTYRGVFRISVDESQPVFAKKFKFENLDDLGLGEEYVGVMGKTTSATSG